MRCGADAADALSVSACIPRVSALEDYLEASKECALALCIFYNAIIHDHIDGHVAFYSCDGVYFDYFPHFNFSNVIFS